MILQQQAETIEIVVREIVYRQFEEEEAENRSVMESRKKKKDLKEKSGDFVYVKSRNPLNGIAKVSLRVRRRLARRMHRLSEQARPRLSLGRGGRKRGDTL